MMSGKLQQSDLIESVAVLLKSYDKRVVKEIIDEFLQHLETALLEGHEVTLRGFGSFKLKVVKSRKYTGLFKKFPEGVISSPRVGIHFRVGDSLLSALKKLPVD